MIPKDEEQGIPLSPLEAFSSFKKISESNELRYRTERLNNPLKVVYKHREGECSLCKSTKRIVSEKHVLCKTCRDWCKRWIIKNYGVYKRQFMTDAMIAATGTVNCRFHDTCGGTLPKMKDGKFLRLAVCNKCYPIWADGVKAGRSHKVKLRRY